MKENPPAAANADRRIFKTAGTLKSVQPAVIYLRYFLKNLLGIFEKSWKVFLKNHFRTLVLASVSYRIIIGSIAFSSIFIVRFSAKFVKKKIALLFPDFSLLGIVSKKIKQISETILIDWRKQGKVTIKKWVFT